jgi:TDG/mug DNA glycosylase family protein
MHRDTVAVYEARADEWLSRRSPLYQDKARAFAERVAGAGPTADLGCGPGFYTGALPAPAVALDAARAMLDLVPARAPDALRVQGDLEALPFRRGALAGAWARNAYVHLPTRWIPLALAQLHFSTRVGAPVELTFFGGGAEGVGLFANDDLPGRFFSLWEPAPLADAVEGAGFTIDELAERSNQYGERAIDVRATRARTLPDFVGPELRVLVCGLNPSLFAADAGIGFARGNNRFWPAALAAGLVSVSRNPWHAVRVDRVGMTDLVKRATPGAGVLTPDEYRAGVERVARLAAWLEPAVVCVLGVTGWRAAVDRTASPGLQDEPLGGRPVYVMPNPSGANAHTTPAELASHFRQVLALT